jgi:hypothetical protein
MIKKFNQFIKEARHKGDKDSISKEDIEDQFLRIKEVLNYVLEIDTYYTQPTNVMIIPPDYDYEKTWNPEHNLYSSELYKELDDIKVRMENMYSNIKIIIHKPTFESFLRVEIFDKKRNYKPDTMPIWHDENFY